MTNTNKPLEISPTVGSTPDFSQEIVLSELEKNFNDVYIIKDVTATVPTFSPKNELACYVRYVSGGTYKLYVYLGATIGWKSCTLS